MKRLAIALVVAAGTATLVACGGDIGAITPPMPQLAFTRFVDAVPDSGGMDWRFVDVIENSPTTFGLNFRSSFPGATYQATGPGPRHLRIFQTSTDINLTQRVLFDTTFDFTAGTHYTLLVAGSMRTGQGKLYILTDDFTDPGAQIAVRIVNAGAGAVDLYASAKGDTTALPAALVSGLDNFASTKYMTMPVGPLDLRGFATGSTTFPAMVDVVAPAGLAADRANDLTAVGGSTQAGSVLTAFIVPKSVGGSTATSFANPGIIFVVDKHPPSGF
jgi:hypothetical protein